MAQLNRGNDSEIKTTAITDIDGNAVMGGTVTAAILTPDGVTELIAAAAATHVAAGVWKRALTAAQIDTIAIGWNFVIQRFVFGSPVDATFDEVIKIGPRIG